MKSLPLLPLFLILWLLGPGAALAQQAVSASSTTQGAQDEPQATFNDEVFVQLFSVKVRALDHEGSPLVGLGPKDFKVKVEKERVDVVAVDWIPAGPQPAVVSSPVNQPLEPHPPQQEIEETPRLVVFFVQTSAVPHRATGLRWALKHIDTVLDALHPTDRVAVVDFHHHLKMRRDFTHQRRDIRRALEEAILFKDTAPVPPAEPPSLAAGFDPERAFDAGFVETGLEVTADALRDLPGEKLVIFLGWGFGSEYGVAIEGAPTPRLRSALDALHRAEATVSALAVGNLLSHGTSNLDRSIERVAAATGGGYAKLFPMMDLAIQRLSRTLEGHYLVTFAVDSLETQGKVVVSLRKRRFSAHHREFFLQRAQDS